MASQLVCFGMEKKGKRQHKYDEVSAVLDCAPFTLDKNSYIVGNFVRINEKGSVFPTFCAEGIISGASPLMTDKDAKGKAKASLDGMQYTCDFGKLSDEVAIAYAQWTDSLCELMWVAIHEVKTYLESEQDEACKYYNSKSNIEIEQVDAFIASMKIKYGAAKSTPDERHFKAFVEDVIVKKYVIAAAKAQREVKASATPHLKIWASLKRFVPPTLIYTLSDDRKTKTPMNGDDIEETAAIMKKAFPVPMEGSFISARALLRVGPTRVCNSSLGFSIKPTLHEIAIIGTPCDAQSARAAAARKAIEEEDAEDGITITAKGSVKSLIAVKKIVEEDEEEEERETPKPKKKKPAVHVASDDEEEESPKPKKKKPAVHVASDEEETPKPKKKKSAAPVASDEEETPKPKKKQLAASDEKPKKKKLTVDVVEILSDDDKAAKPPRRPAARAKPESDEEDEQKPPAKKDKRVDPNAKPPKKTVKRQSSETSGDDE